MVPALHPRTPENQLTESETSVGAEEAPTEQGQVDLDSDVRWWLRVQVGTHTVRALYDSGASTTVMGPLGLQLANACGRTFTPTRGRFATLANGLQSQIAGYAYLPMEVGGVCEEVRVAILMELDSDCLIGVNFIRKFKAVLDPCDHTLLIKDTGEKVHCELATVNARGGSAIASVGPNELTEGQQKQQQVMLDRVLGQVPQPPKLRYTHMMERDIDVRNAQPIKHRSYNYSPKSEEAMHQQVKRLLEGVMEDTSGAWVVPAAMVKRGNGKYRLCIDFLKVNMLSKPDSYYLSSSGQESVQKLAPKFAGSYQVTRVLGSDAYELTSRDGTVARPVYIQQRKRCHVTPGWMEGTLPPRDVEGPSTSGDVDRSVSPNASGQETQTIGNSFVRNVVRPSRKRGRPRKTVCVVQRPNAAPTRNSAKAVPPNESATPPQKCGRPKRSRNVGVNPDAVIATRTRSQRKGASGTKLSPLSSPTPDGARAGRDRPCSSMPFPATRRGVLVRATSIHQKTPGVLIFPLCHHPHLLPFLA